jgi:hypothetical protein
VFLYAFELLEVDGEDWRPSTGIQQHGPSVGYSITSSRMARIPGGTVIPRALAVLRLMTSSNLVGRSIGSSLTLAPRRRRST